MTPAATLEAACEGVPQIMMSRAGVARRGHDVRNGPIPSGPLGKVYRELMLGDDLPATPEVALAIMAIVDKEDADVADLAALVPRDPALATRLLAVSNGLYFSAARRITDIRQAVTMLGFARVREIVTTLSVGEMLRLDDANPEMLHTWRHGLLVAGAAKLLARGVGLRSEEAFIAGVLHDIGKLVFGLRFRDVYWDLVARATETGEPLEALELATWDCHHGTVGSWLLQNWGLSGNFIEPVARHHDPLVVERDPKLWTIVSVANRLVGATNDDGELAPEVREECRPFLPKTFTPARWMRAYTDLLANNDALLMLCDQELGA